MLCCRDPSAGQHLWNKETVIMIHEQWPGASTSTVMWTRIDGYLHFRFFGGAHEFRQLRFQILARDSVSTRINYSRHLHSEPNYSTSSGRPAALLWRSQWTSLHMQRFLFAYGWICNWMSLTHRHSTHRPAKQNMMRGEQIVQLSYKTLTNHSQISAKTIHSDVWADLADQLYKLRIGYKCRVENSVQVAMPLLSKNRR
jgi:hypothetical protein